MSLGSENKNASPYLECEDLRKLVWITAPAMSDNGRYGAWLKGTSDYESGNVNTLLQETMLEENEKENIFQADKMSGYVQKNPVYSPGGRYLAFLASDGRPWQLWLYDRKKDEVRKLTSFRYGVNAPVWSQGGSMLAFEVAWYPEKALPDTGEMTKEEYQSFCREWKDQPKVIENLIYKMDEAYGILDGSRMAIGVCRIQEEGREEPGMEDNSCRILLKLDVSYKMPSFVKNDTKIVCYSYFEKHFKELQCELVEITIDQGECRKIEKSVPTYYEFPVLEQKDEYIYCGAAMEEGSAMAEVFAVPALGGESRQMFSTLGICHGVDPLLVGDTHLAQRDCPIQKDEDGKLYILSFHERKSNVFEYDGETLSPITREECILDFAGPAQGKMLVLKSSWKHPAEIYLFKKDEDGIYRQKRQITEENHWLDDYRLTEPVAVMAESKDKKANIRGWAAVPEDKIAVPEDKIAVPEDKIAVPENKIAESENERAKLPAVLDVHGGPEGCYVNGFFFEVQVMAGRGMAVLFADPRGAAGYGPEFMRDEYAYGQEAVDDYLAFVEECCSLFPQIDKKRIGVTGGSYGGHMTNKLASVTQAFAAAVTQRTWVNPSTSYGTGDMGFYSAGAKGTFMEYMEERVHKSIMKYVRNIRIPFLILHGEKDYRCGLEQGEQVYHVLRSVSPDLPVKIVIFPEENHGVTRAGKIHNQIRHMKEMADWFSKYLGEGEEKNEQ